MRLTLFALCEQAFFDHKHQLHVSSVIDHVTAAELPTALRHVAVALGFHDVNDEAVLPILLKITDSHGHASTLRRDLPVQPSASQTVYAILQIPELVLSYPGEYTLQVIGRDGEMGKLKLVVISQ